MIRVVRWTFIMGLGLIAAMPCYAFPVDGSATLVTPSTEIPIGLWSGETFQHTTGATCDTCQTPPAATWYFEHEPIAIPKNPAFQAGQATTEGAPPFLVWTGSPWVIQSARLSEDMTSLVTPDRQRIRLQLTPQLVTNRAYVNDATVRFFETRPVRLRGELMATSEGLTFRARTLWPLDWRLTRNTTTIVSDPTPSIHDLIDAHNKRPDHPLITHLLYDTESPASWAGKAVFGLVLSGAQGDDDEALGGHIGAFTGRMGSQGEWADWLVNNFYDPDWVSEKGIIPAMTPMDQYLTDLNSGQSYYRPSYLLVMILKQDRLPLRYQDEIQHALRDLYAHVIDYDHANRNCAGLTIDPLRALGWQIPLQGPTHYLKGLAALPYVGVTEWDFQKGLSAYHYLTEEQTRLLPRPMMEAVGTDLLDLLNTGAPTRTLSPFEVWLHEDVEAVLFVQIPQIPSSRAWGTAPVTSLDDYEQRVPKDRSQWKTVPVDPKPFPEALRTVPMERPFVTPPQLLTVTGGLLVGSIIVRVVKRRRRKSE